MAVRQPREPGFLLLIFFPKEKKISKQEVFTLLRILTVEYDPIKKSFDDSALSTFLAGKSVISIEKLSILDIGHPALKLLAW
ncbi:MAG: hypothetical protein WCS62_05890 [Bacilli bacterium]